MTNLFPQPHSRRIWDESIVEQLLRESVLRESGLILPYRHVRMKNHLLGIIMETSTATTLQHYASDKGTVRGWDEGIACMDLDRLV